MGTSPDRRSSQIQEDDQAPLLVHNAGRTECGTDHSPAQVENPSPTDATLNRSIILEPGRDVGKLALACLLMQHCSK